LYPVSSPFWEFSEGALQVTVSLLLLRFAKATDLGAPLGAGKREKKDDVIDCCYAPFQNIRR
jgi:hypothetical protein